MQGQATGETAQFGPPGWALSEEQVARLDQASAVTPPYPYYPYWNGQFAERSPVAVSQAA